MRPAVSAAAHSRAPPRLLACPTCRPIGATPLGSPPRREVFWETTGLNGQSSVREVDVESGKVLRKKDLPAVRPGGGTACRMHIM